RARVAGRGGGAGGGAGPVCGAERARGTVEPASGAAAVLGGVDLGTAGGTVSSADGRVRLLLHGTLADTEPGAEGLLERYLDRGEAALRGLSGSFALALWDARLGRLHLANDRFGLRNVYYAATSERILFAPLVRALLEDARIARTLDAQAAAEFLTFQCVLGDRTLVDGVRLLPPASLLVFEVGQGVRLERTWRLRYRSRPLADHAHVLASA